MYGARAVAAFVSTVRGAPWLPLCQLYGVRRGRLCVNCTGRAVAGPVATV